MLDQGTEPDNLEAPIEEKPVEESSNRTFIIAVGILGGLVLLTIIGVLLYAFVLGPKIAKGSESAQATAEAHNLAIAQAMTATNEAALWTATPEPTQVALATQTSTPVVSMPTNTPTNEYDPLTATMGALYTQAAIAQLTPTSTLISMEGGALPEGGFADQYGIPGLLLLAAVLVVVIFMARRLRTSPSRQK
jgi:hypothetical protein